MNKYIIILIVILLISSLVCQIKITEFFQANIYNAPDCCVIRKKRVNDKFKYFYNKSQYCDAYHDGNLRTINDDELINGEPFNMNDCKENLLNPIFGSCRRLGSRQCTEFLTEKDCKKYPNMVWDKATCFDKIPIEVNYYKYSVKNLKPLYTIV